jgi:3-mercaptopyruvate sulfurtransferase SseA
MLIRNGVKRVRPLEGGLEAWKERGYPLEETTLDSAR